MDYILLGLVLLAIPFVLPIVSWIYAYGTRSRVRLLEDKVEEQARRIEALSAHLRAETHATSAPSSAPMAGTATAAPPAGQSQQTAATPPPPVDLPRSWGAMAAAAEPARPAPAVVPQPPPAQAAERPSVATAIPVPPHTPERPPAAPIVSAPQPAPTTASATPPGPPVLPTRTAPPRAPEPPPPPSAGFDWEGLVGVRLFSAIAGIALVIAAISFLRYSIEHGWIEPPVRVAIGIVAAIVLLVLCELKAARKYPVTANAMDAAAIAILFSTFFAAHALWNLIGSGATFMLLALVTAVAVLLSIRRESLFIAVLGLLGGFATPILLSTGENQPIPLFTYLLLLNIGLAWVAYRKGWTLLTILTLVLTTVYQWGWVFKFLSVSQVPLAMGIFIVFPVTALALLVLGSRGTAPGAGTFERTAAIGAAAPLLFAIYLAAVPEYGAHAGLLFGFLFLLAAGLFAIALALGRELLHAAGAVTTLLVFAIHRINHPAPLPQIVLFDALFVVFYLAAPTIAGRIGREFDREAAAATLAAPLLLFVPATLAGTADAASPLFLFAVLFVLVCLVSLRAIAAGEGVLYFVAMFFVVAAEAHWSIRHLTEATLGSGVAMYAAFGLLQLGIPLAARRWAEPLQPRAGAGVTLIASLGMLLFLAIGGVAPVALWGLALLLALLNAALFVESAAEDLPALSIVGGLASWLVLAVWWWDAAGAVDVMSSLLVMLGLSLVMLGGHAWQHARAGRPASAEGVHFSHGVYLGLIGYLFLFFVASNPAWSVPPSPLFGALAVLTLAVATTAVVTRVRVLHVASIAAAGIVLLSWTMSVGDAPWPSIALLCGAVLAVFALTWVPVFDARTASRGGAIAAVVALFASEAIAVAAGGHGASAPGVVLLALSHAVTLAVLLGVAWRYRWHDAALATAFPAALALVVWRLAHPEKSWWGQFLAFAGVIYAVLTAYPFVLGRRARQLREPYLLAIAASAIFFFAARNAFIAGDLRWMIGAVPVAEGLVLALLLRQLLGIEQPGQRDLGRLALVAGAALAFVTVAIPMQLRNQWITIGWALEGAALAWLYTRIVHRGLLYSAVALLATAFVRLAVNPAVFQYQPRGANRVFNWYLYAYAIAAVAMLAASWWLSRTGDNLVADGGPSTRASRWLPAAACILLFELLNIEIADFYAAGPEITFRFGATLAQDLTYTIGWLMFGMLLLGAGIALGSHAARVAALILITVTTFKCFLYDLSSLGGLYRVASFVGLGVSLALVSLALQKYVLVRSQETTS